MDLVGPWFEHALDRLPGGVDVWDAHTHTGWSDPDGVRGTADRLVEKLATARHAGAVVMTNRDPGGYPSANDRILAEALASDGRLIPFLRVDPRRGREAEAEVERSLDAGHQGIKLHPRAEEFALSSPAVARIARIAAERSVPILVHAGRGIPSLGTDARSLLDSVEGVNVILAHAAISDLSWLGPVSAEVPGLYVDTSWWDVTDLLALFAWVPPHRILYASDTPYGHPQLGFTLTMRVALAAGYGERELAALFGGSITDLVSGRSPNPLESAAVDVLDVDPALLRLFASLHGAIVRAFDRSDPTEFVQLARLACNVGEGAGHRDLYDAIASTLDRIDPKGARRDVVRPLIVAAAAVMTPAAGAPIL